MNKQKTFHKLKIHLWIRGLCLTFALILILILFFTAWKYADFNFLLDARKNNITENHCYISTVLYAEVYLTASKEKENIVPLETVKKSMKELISYDLGEVALFYNGQLITGTYNQNDPMDNLLLQSHNYSNECYLEECKLKGSYLIKAVSKITLLNENYILITTTDISDLYNLKSELTTRIIVLSILIGLFVASPFFLALRDFFRHSTDNFL